MLIRVLVAVDPPAVRRRVARLVREPGVELTTTSVRANLWERLNREEVDLVLLGTDGKEPPATFIASIRDLPDRPEVVVLRPREDAEERARLLASGCLAVLWLGLPDAMLAGTIKVFVDRRRDDELRRMRADRPDERYSLN